MPKKNQQNDQRQNRKMPGGQQQAPGTPQQNLPQGTADRPGNNPQQAGTKKK